MCLPVQDRVLKSLLAMIEGIFRSFVVACAQHPPHAGIIIVPEPQASFKVYVIAGAHGRQLDYLVVYFTGSDIYAEPRFHGRGDVVFDVRYVSECIRMLVAKPWHLRFSFEFIGGCMRLVYGPDTIDERLRR